MSPKSVPLDRRRLLRGEVRRAGRQDRQRAGPALGEVRDPQRHRQPPGRASTPARFLDGKPNGIPSVADLAEAIAARRRRARLPDLRRGPADGLLSPHERVVLLDGIARGMHIVNGLHEFLNDDAEFVAAAAARTA